MILIADSGSTKTDWSLIENKGSVRSFSTPGINPVHQSQQEVATLIADGLHLLAEESRRKLTGIYFYGAGCTNERSAIVSSVLRQLFPSTPTVEVANDMLGAARALCGSRPGIVCILGTGSNSCYYDGQRIVLNTPPLGYILGDEGSGAALGKRLVGDCLKGLLPEPLCRAFLSENRLTMPDIIEQVYRRPMANRYLASLSRFLAAHREEACIHRLIVECFDEFIRRNLLSYPKLPLYTTGSIAHYYADELQEAAARHGLHIAATSRRPIEGLIEYHTNPNAL